MSLENPYLKYLIDSAFRGDLERVRMHISQGFEMNALDDRGTTPLHAAIENRQAAVVEALLRAGASTELKTASGWTPLAHAIDIEAVAADEVRDPTAELTALLLEFGADPNEPNANGKTPIQIAEPTGHKTAIALLHNRGVR